MRPGDERLFQGTVHLMPRPAVHVVSDIDDTIKVSQVRDKPELLMNTFCRPFRPAPGMAELYRKWDAGNVRFHYVSASPWQLYPPLAEFIREHRFPGGTFAMKPFRIQDGTALNVLGTQNTYKRSIIEPLIQQFPHDQFVLVGDTGEQDPRSSPAWQPTTHRSSGCSFATSPTKRQRTSRSCSNQSPPTAGSCFVSPQRSGGPRRRSNSRDRSQVHWADPDLPEPNALLNISKSNTLQRSLMWLEF